MSSSYTLLIDSSERQNPISTNANDFLIAFPHAFTDITKVRLNWLQIPLAVYQITSSNRTFTFADNFPTNDVHTCSLTIGWYTAR